MQGGREIFSVLNKELRDAFCLNFSLKLLQKFWWIRHLVWKFPNTIEWHLLNLLSKGLKTNVEKAFLKFVESRFHIKELLHWRQNIVQAAVTINLSKDDTYLWQRSGTTPPLNLIPAKFVAWWLQQNFMNQGRKNLLWVCGALKMNGSWITWKHFRWPQR